jgi:hypothetical protein
MKYIAEPCPLQAPADRVNGSLVFPLFLAGRLPVLKLARGYADDALEQLVMVWGRFSPLGPLDILGVLHTLALLPPLPDVLGRGPR